MITDPRERRLSLAIAILLLVVTASVYAPVRHFDFVNYDDDDYVVHNPQVLAGLTSRSIAWAFTHFHAGNWHPLTWLSHMFDFSLWGLHPGGHHLSNAILHAATAVLIFAVCKAMTRDLWPSAFVAAVFAWHPLHVESVAWISERKDVLCAFFWFATIGAYLRYVARRRFVDYTLVALAFACAIMSKAMAVTLPCVLLLLDFWPLQRAGFTREARRRWIGLLREKVPLFALVALASIVTLASQRSFGAIRSSAEVPWHLRIANVPVSYLNYIRKAFWPTELAVFYPLHPSIAWSATLGAVVILLAITFVVLHAGKEHPYLPVGWLWFLGTLVPVIGLVQIGIQAMADRYMYLPLVGLSIMVAWGVPALLRASVLKAPMLAASAAAVLGLCVVTTAKQLPVWRDSISLYDHAFAVASRTGRGSNAVPPLLFDGLADGLLRAGRLLEADEIVARAREQFPENGKRLNLAGLIKMQLKQSAEAEALWKRAIEIEPTWYQTYNSLGILYTNTHRLDNAQASFERVVELRPDDPIALGNLAQVCLLQKDYDAARRYVSRGLRAAPNDDVLRGLQHEIERQRR